MAEELEYPVAYCNTCKEKGPVVIESFPGDNGVEFMAVFCPECSSIINVDQEVSLEWYIAEDVAKVTGWRVVDGE